MFSQGRFPYQDTNVYPFYSSNYPPLFHVIAAPFVWLFGDGLLVRAAARLSGDAGHGGGDCLRRLPRRRRKATLA